MGARATFGEHEGSERVARGAAENSCTSGLFGIYLDERVLFFFKLTLHELLLPVQFEHFENA